MEQTRDNLISTDTSEFAMEYSDSNICMKTPVRLSAPRRKSGFQQYLQQELRSLGSKYTFLTQQQLKSKAAQSWSKLTDKEKDDYRPIKISNKTPVKKQTLASKVAAARSPGVQLKARCKTENFTPPRRSLKYNDTKSPFKASFHPVALKSPRAPRESFDYDNIDEDLDLGLSRLDSEENTPVSESSDSVTFDTSQQTDKHYGGSNRISTRRRFKPPHIVHDEPIEVQSGILKEKTPKGKGSAKKNQGRVSFGTQRTMVQKKQYLVSPPSDASFSPLFHQQSSDWIKDHKKRLKITSSDSLPEKTDVSADLGKETLQSQQNNSDADDFYGLVDDDGDSDDEGACQLICREEEYVEGDSEEKTDVCHDKVDIENIERKNSSEVEGKATDLNGSFSTQKHYNSQPAKECNKLKTSGKRKRGRPPKNSISPNNNEDRSLRDKVTDRPSPSDSVRSTRSRTRSIGGVSDQTVKRLTEREATVHKSNVSKVSSNHHGTGMFKTPSLPIVLLSDCNKNCSENTPKNTSSVLKTLAQRKVDKECARTPQLTAAGNPDDCTPQMSNSLLKATIQQAVKPPRKRRRSDVIKDKSLPGKPDHNITDKENKPKRARKSLQGNKEDGLDDKPILEMMSPYEKRKYLNKIKQKPLDENNNNHEAVKPTKKVEISSQNTGNRIETADQVIQNNLKNKGEKFPVKQVGHTRQKRQATMDRYMLTSLKLGSSNEMESNPKCTSVVHQKKDCSSESEQFPLESTVTAEASNIPEENVTEVSEQLASTSHDKLTEYNLTKPVTKSVAPQKTKVKENTVSQPTGKISHRKKARSNARPTLPNNPIQNLRSSFSKSFVLDMENDIDSDSTGLSQSAAVVDETIMLMRQLVTPLVTTRPSWMENDDSIFSSPNVLSPAWSGISELSHQNSVGDWTDLFDTKDSEVPREHALMPEANTENFMLESEAHIPAESSEIEDTTDTDSCPKLRKSKRTSISMNCNNTDDNTKINKKTRKSADVQLQDSQSLGSLISDKPDLPDVVPARHPPGSKSYSKPRSKQNFDLMDLFDQISPQRAKKDTPGPSRRCEM